MNDDAIIDLKQFIAATVSQATADLPTRAEMNERFDTLRSEMSERFDTVDTKLTTIADAHAEQLENHEHRLNRLEQPMTK